MSHRDPAGKFDYASLLPDVAEQARSIVARCRARRRAVHIEGGRDLIAIKQRMEHGTFGAFIRDELGITPRAAENYMNAARFLEGKSETLSHLPSAILYALAAPTAPAAVVDAVVAAAAAGTPLTAAEIKKRLARARTVDRHDAPRTARRNALPVREPPAVPVLDQTERRAHETSQPAAQPSEQPDRLRPLADHTAACMGLHLPDLLTVLKDDRQAFVQLLDDLAKDGASARTPVAFALSPEEAEKREGLLAETWSRYSGNSDQGTGYEPARFLGQDMQDWSFASSELLEFFGIRETVERFRAERMLAERKAGRKKRMSATPSPGEADLGKSPQPHTRAADQTPQAGTAG